MPTPPLSPPHHHRPENRTAEEQPAASQGAAERYALIAAGIVIVALTAGAFCLSYAHLADVAGQHGLGDSPVRRWAWPATLDAFIVAGELLMLRAGLRRITDRWATAVTAIGSAGSIALNVAGVSGTRETGDVPFLDYVVAAVPPAAAMVAFAVLMRQIHQLVDQHPLAGSGQVLRASVTTPLRAAVSDGSPQPPAEVAETKSRGGRPPGAPLGDLVEIGRAACAEQGKLTRATVRKAVEDKGLPISSKRLTEVTNVLRNELTATAESGPASG
ncbi:DUF2637 domain-containing protein [Streptomyces sp. CA-278952]|uniref:DUF2637 domain-containing protein n=1 Tax=Streptomyces sp. CA-278952 TaxID=2980556 RepID=UPI00236771A0|nr:DUF2637 domain-containing protein [Streptomyces sp. CA-278952]WDG30652.1 DUF2637 domain-containing protein [Streptomyces sp. CA-278952]